jgi:AraC family transcriptional regulator, transcriptional activator of pobA
MNTAVQYASPDAFRDAHHNTISERSADTDQRFEIHAIEWTESQPYAFSFLEDRFSNFDVIWIKKGKGLLESEGQDFALSQNAMHCIFPGHARKITIEQGTQGYYISFAIEFLKLSEGYCNSSAWLEQYDSCKNIILSAVIEKEMQAEFEIVAKKMTWEFSNYFNRRLELLKGLLNVFMIYFSRTSNAITHAAVPNREKELVNKFISLLKRNFSSKKLVNDYASLICVSPNYLNRIVKKITGFTTRHHIQQQIILEAKRQAMYSSVSMKQIAYNLGFDNLAHFSKFFKNNCGVSFSDFKKKGSGSV